MLSRRKGNKQKQELAIDVTFRFSKIIVVWKEGSQKIVLQSRSVRRETIRI